MKLRSVTELDKRNKTTSKKKERKEKKDDDLMSANCDVIVILPIYGQFGAMRNPDSGRIIFKTYIFIKSYLSSCKN